LIFLGSRWGPQVSLPHFYSLLVWGGIWGIVLLFPGFSKLAWYQVTLLLCLFPTAAECLYFFPHNGAGWFGLSLGLGTPFVIFLSNLLWAVITVFSSSRS